VNKTRQAPRQVAFSARAFEEILRPFVARIFGFWRGFGEGAGLKNPVTEPKRSQKSKRPLVLIYSNEWPQYF
jgi:hypothetical protein